MDRSGRSRRRWSGLVVALGAVVALLLADLAVGSGLRRLWPIEPVAEIPSALNVTGHEDTEHDPRADLPSMAAYPWADEYYREIQLTPHSYWPFTESRPRSFDGEFITIEGWERRTYRSADADDDAPVVWMFGGSAAWGEGQRDEHTIASELVRRAEADGTPIIVRNFGQRGWTHFQEMILFEQLLAAEAPPDVAVFYDGANEVNAQSLSVTGVPSHTMADQYAELISGGVADEYRAPPESASWWARLRDSYSEHSAVRRAVLGIESVFGGTASALTPAQAAQQVYAPSEADAEAAMDVYKRGRRLSQHLADRYDVEAMFVWQPTQPSRVEQHARSLLTAPTIDLSGALDDRRDTFVDGVHTNEEGATLAANALWGELAGRLPGEHRSATTTTTAPPADRSVVPAAETISQAAAALDDAASDPCATDQWKVWLGSLRAETAEDRQRVGELAQRFLRLTAASASEDLAADVAVVLATAAEIPAHVAASEIDPTLPLVPQLPVVDDASNPFLASFGRLSGSIEERCTEARSKSGPG